MEEKRDWEDLRRKTRAMELTAEDAAAALGLERRARVSSVATISKPNKQVLVTGTPVFDANGNIKLVVSNTRDFAGLKMIEQRLLAELTEKGKKADEELAYLRQRQTGGNRVFYRSGAMHAVMELVLSVAPTDVTVLITGESGTTCPPDANDYEDTAD